MIGGAFEMSKVKRRGKYSSKAKYVILTLIIVSIIIGAAIIMSLPPKKKPPASQYLHVTHTVSVGEFYDQNTTVKIKILGLNITALEDAHSLLVIAQAQPEPEYKDSLAKGETWSLAIELRGLVRHLNEGSFRVEVGISCSEAEPEYVPVYLNPEDIIGVPARYP